MNKKGFTLVELLAVISILAILLAFATWTYTRYLKSSRVEALSLAMNSFEDAFASAYDDCKNGSTNSICENILKLDDRDDSGDYTSQTVYLSDLISGQYIDEINNPYNKGEYCDKNNSYIVAVREKVSTSHTNPDGSVTDLGEDESNVKFKYMTCVRCGKTGSEVRNEAAKLMIKKGYEDSDIINCTELSQSRIDTFR